MLKSQSSAAEAVMSTVGDAGGGRFEFDDGGFYCGTWLEGKAHGFGVCTGPQGHGEYAGAWNQGFETSGTYTWPSGNVYTGEWADGRRHGLGAETHGRWIYRGEWTAGVKGRYGVRHSNMSGARYEGTWVGGLQDGFGVETYADQSTYQGQWMRGLRHGYGVRQSAPFDAASPYRDHPEPLRGRKPQQVEEHHNSLPAVNADPLTNRGRSLERGRSGFALTGSANDPTASRQPTPEAGQRPRSRSASLRRTIADGLSGVLHRKKKKHQSSTSDITKEAVADGSPASPSSELSSIDLAPTGNIVETYMGEWRADKRCGYGISQRSDGLRYSGEWYNDKRSGYGSTIYPDGRPDEQGKYKDNALVDSAVGTRKLFALRLSKLRERVDVAVLHAQKAAEIAAIKADVAAARRSNATVKADQAAKAAKLSVENSERAKEAAEKYAHNTASPTLTSEARQGESRPGLGHSFELSVAPEVQQRVSALGSSKPESATDGSSFSPNPHSTSDRNVRADGRPSSVPPAPTVASDTGPSRALHEQYERSSRQDDAGDEGKRRLHRTEDVSPTHVRVSSSTPQAARSAARSTASQHGDDQISHSSSHTTPRRLVDSHQPPADSTSVPNSSRPARTETDYQPVAAQLGSTESSGRHDASTNQQRPRVRDVDSNYVPAGRQFDASQSDVLPEVRTVSHQLRSAALPFIDDSSDEVSGRPAVSGRPVDSDDRHRNTPSSQPESRSRSRQQRSSQLPAAEREQRTSTSSAVQAAATSAATDESVTDSVTAQSAARSRRLTLPSVVHYRVHSRQQPVQLPVSKAAASDRPPSTVYVLSDGVRRRLVSSAETSPPKPTAPTTTSKDFDGSSDLAELASLPEHYRLEPTAAVRDKLGKSMTRIDRAGGEPVMRREEVSVLSQQRRDEIRRQREEDEQKVVILRFSDIKDWCQRHDVALFFLTLNLALAALFYQLLAPEKNTAS